MKKYLNFLFYFLLPTPVLALSTLDRYWTLIDKDMTLQMVQGTRYGVAINAHALTSTNIFTIIKDAKNASKTSGTTTDKQLAVENVLNKYNHDEVIANGAVDLSISLPHFSLLNAKIMPSLMGHYNLGALMALSKPPTSTFNDPNLGVITVPANVPVVQGYAVETIKSGVNFDWENKDYPFFGALGLYHMHRWDRVEVIDRDTIVTQNKIFDMDKPKNTTQTLNTDIKIGYQWTKNLRTFISAQELRLLKFSDRNNQVGKLYVNKRALYRLHADYSMTLSSFKLNPFLGFHYRNGYGLGDGWYLGANAGFTVLQGLGMNMVGMLENNFFTLNPRLQFWFLRLDYEFKIPIQAHQDGFNVKPIHGATINLTIPYGNS